MPALSALRPVPPAVQGTLALTYPTSAVPARPQLRLVTDAFGPVPTPSAALPPVAAWSARLAVAVVEALQGARPAGQLVRWVSHEVMEGLQRRVRTQAQHPSQRPAALRRTRRAPLAVRALRWTEPADGVAEVAAVVVGEARPVVLTLRLEGLDGRWTCVQVGSPDGWSIATTPDDSTP
jgi:hypothetical protein